MIDPSLVDSLADQCRPLAGSVAVTCAGWTGLERPIAEDMSTVLRNLHTIKGGFAFFGFDAIRDLAHDLEEALGELRDHVIDPTPQLMDAVVAATSALAASVSNPWNAEITNLSELRHALHPWREQALDELPETDQTWPLTPTPMAAAQCLRRGQDILRITLHPRQDIDAQHRTLLDINDLIQLLGTPLAIASDTTAIHGLDDCLDAAFDLQVLLATDADQDMASDMLELPREQIEHVDLSELIGQGDRETNQGDLAELYVGLCALTTDLGQRIGHQASAAYDCPVIQLPGTLRHDLQTILSHMLRNAIDHGIESPEVRQAGGKPSSGMVRLTGAISDSDELILSISDDGGGVDLERVVERAQQRGLIDPGDQPDITKPETVYPYLFAPGFTTRNEVTTVSGRGLGLDVVKALVDQLGGHLSMTSKLGTGTTFTIRLPMPALAATP